MKLSLSRTFQLLLYIVVSLITTNKISLAQVTSDGTVNTQVDNDGGVAEITEGETRGDNLFHSFQDFSVPVNNEAFFNNANEISNIFSRVTGGNISNIDGLISSNGSANLFLINPAGIIFGQGASLNIGGSFYGSSADSILFNDGEFSASDLDNPPLLTVNAPIGLGFRDNPGDLVNNSVANDGNGLEVMSGNNITLVGGNISLDNGNLVAQDGTINLGGLSAQGVVKLNDNGSLSFPQDVAQADLAISNDSTVSVLGTGEGNIKLDARNLELSSGDLGLSAIKAGVNTNSTNTQGGDIVVNVAEDLAIDGSSISNQVESGSGSAGDVIVNTGTLSLTNGGQINTSTSGQGNAGSIEITATDSVSIKDRGVDFQSGVASIVASEAVGDAGGVSIDTSSLSLTDGGVIRTSTAGQGNAGSVKIIATDSVLIDGQNSLDSSSAVASVVASEAEGDAGGITINTSSLSLTNGGVIFTDISGRGNAGSVKITATDTISIDSQNNLALPSAVASVINPGAKGDAGSVSITTDSLSLTNGGTVSTSTAGQGNAGSVEITATDTVSIDGQNSLDSSSAVASVVASEAEGDAGDLSIDTGSLSLTDGGVIRTSTAGQGNAGSVKIIATDAVAIDAQGNISGAISLVEPGAVGDAGSVSIDTGSLSLNNGGIVSTNILGQGNAGSVKIIATDTISIDGQNDEGNPSVAGSRVIPEAVGDAGDVTINTSFLSLTNGGKIATNIAGQGNAGSVEIIATDTISIDGQSNAGNVSGVDSLVEPEAEGNAGGVSIDTGSLSLTNGGEISTSILGKGNAGSIEIVATDTISIDGQSDAGNSSGVGSQVQSEAEGDAGSVNITTSSLFLTDGGAVSTSILGKGNAGSVKIIATDTISIDSQGNSSIVNSQVERGAEGDAGNVSINTGTLSLTNGGQINTNTFGQGNAGSVEIMATDTISIDGQSDRDFSSGVASGVASEAEGDAGGVSINTSSLSLTNGGQIDVSTLGRGNAGSIEIIATDSISIDGQADRGTASGIFSAVQAEAVGDAGGVTVNTGSLSLTNSGSIATGAFGQGQAGQLTIEAESLSLDNNAGIISSTRFDEGGIVDLKIAESITLKNNSSISAQAFEDANGGNLAIDAKFIIAADSNNDLIASAEQGIGGNITINAESIFGLEEGALNDSTNDINASSEVSGLDGNIDITTLDTNPIQGATELPTNVVVPEETTAQACQANREIAAKNGLTIEGKGGVPPAPELPLNSLNALVDGQSNNSISALPQAVETSQGKIQPARGIEVTKSGEIKLTAYRTNSAGSRIPEGETNCGVSN